MQGFPLRSHAVTNIKYFKPLEVGLCEKVKEKIMYLLTAL